MKIMISEAYFKWNKQHYAICPDNNRESNFEEKKTTLSQILIIP